MHEEYAGQAHEGRCQMAKVLGSKDGEGERAGESGNGGRDGLGGKGALVFEVGSFRWRFLGMSSMW